METGMRHTGTFFTSAVLASVCCATAFTQQASPSGTETVAIDAVTGIFLGVEFLNGDVFTEGVHGPDLSLHNFLVNGPHILIPVTMLWIGFWLSKRVKVPA